PDGLVRIVHELREVNRHPSRSGDLLCRTPAEGLRRDDALGSITAQEPEQRSRDRSFVLSKRCLWRAVPFLEVIRCPSEGLVEMTVVAGVRSPGGDAARH